MLKKALEVAIEAALEAGKVIMTIYKTDHEIHTKEDDSPLTCADQAADQVITNMLEQAFPSHAILSEESIDDLKRLDMSYCWVVDPLDGTKEFIHHTDEFTVNIALVKDHQAILGVVYVPVTDELYYAYKGGGSYYRHKGETHVNSVSHRKDHLRILSSKYHKSDSFLDFIERHASIISSIESVGSSLKGCMIARGVAECYYRFGLTSEWDTAAVQVVVEEAGGIFKEMDHQEMRYNRQDTLNRKGFYIVNHMENVLDQ